jgi:hypothetical protein
LPVACPNNTYNDQIGSQRVCSCKRCPDGLISFPASTKVTDCQPTYIPFSADANIETISPDIDSIYAINDFYYENYGVTFYNDVYDFDFTISLQNDTRFLVYRQTPDEKPELRFAFLTMQDTYNVQAATVSSNSVTNWLPYVSVENNGDSQLIYAVNINNYVFVLFQSSTTSIQSRTIMAIDTHYNSTEVDISHLLGGIFDSAGTNLYSSSPENLQDGCGETVRLGVFADFTVNSYEPRVLYVLNDYNPGSVVCGAESCGITHLRKLVWNGKPGTQGCTTTLFITEPSRYVADYLGINAWNLIFQVLDLQIGSSTKPIKQLSLLEDIGVVDFSISEPTNDDLFFVLKTQFYSYESILVSNFRYTFALSSVFNFLVVDNKNRFASFNQEILSDCGNINGNKCGDFDSLLSIQKTNPVISDRTLTTLYIPYSRTVNNYGNDFRVVDFFAVKIVYNACSVTQTFTGTSLQGTCIANNFTEVSLCGKPAGCDSESANCDQNATCTDVFDGFTCSCDLGFTGDGVTCSDDDECTLVTDDCDPNADCTNTPGSFTCACNLGFTGDGISCINNNECTLETDNCNISATCTDTLGSFTCACNLGYSGDGISCINNNECTLATDNCNISATCDDTPGSFTCACNLGYSGDGISCINDNECTLETDNCNTSATCIDTGGSFVCVCNTGYVGDGLACLPCPATRNMWEYYNIVNNTCVFSCVPGAVLLPSGCDPGISKVRTSAMIHLRSIGIGGRGNWLFAGVFYQAPRQWSMPYILRQQTDPFRILWDVRNHPCMQEPTLCCLHYMQQKYVLPDSVALPEADVYSAPCHTDGTYSMTSTTKYTPISTTTYAEARWVLQAAYTQEYTQDRKIALNATGLLLTIQRSGAKLNRVGNVSLEISTNTLLQNQLGVCNVEMHSEDVECSVIVGVVYSNVLSMSPVPRVSFKVTQQRLRLIYQPASVVAVVTEQRHSCIETVFMCIYTDSKHNLWYLTLNFLLDVGSEMQNTSVPIIPLQNATSQYNFSAHDWILGYGEKGGSMRQVIMTDQFIREQTVDDSAGRMSFALTMSPNVSLPTIKQLHQGVIILSTTLSTNTCIDVLHVTVPVDTAIEVGVQSMLYTTDTALQVWVLYGLTTSIAFTPLTVFQSDQTAIETISAMGEVSLNHQGRMMAIATTLHGNQTSVLIDELSIFSIKGGADNALALENIQSALEKQNFTAAAHVCRNQHKRVCMLTTDIRHGITLRTPATVLLNADVCDRGGGGWHIARQTIKNFTALSGTFADIQIVKYMTHVCRFVQQHGLTVSFVRMPQYPWPKYHDDDEMHTDNDSMSQVSKSSDNTICTISTRLYDRLATLA